MKTLFAPLGIGAGLLAGIAARKGFERIWSAVDDEEPPEPEQREVSLAKLAAALVIEGAVFRLTKGFVDHGARRGFAAMTGRWPGEDSGSGENES